MSLRQWTGNYMVELPNLKPCGERLTEMLYHGQNLADRSPVSTYLSPQVHADRKHHPRERIARDHSWCVRGHLDRDSSVWKLESIHAESWAQIPLRGTD